MDRTTSYAMPDSMQALAGAAMATVQRLLNAAHQARREREARRELHRLSDHLLRDIGLQRAQIDSLFRP